MSAHHKVMHYTQSYDVPVHRGYLKPREGERDSLLLLLLLCHCHGWHYEMSEKVIAIVCYHHGWWCKTRKRERVVATVHCCHCRCHYEKRKREGDGNGVSLSQLALQNKEEGEGDGCHIIAVGGIVRQGKGQGPG